ncbi:MAG: hypothetical protein ACP5FL_09025 [Thermoplasmatota archaeon]
MRDKLGIAAGIGIALSVVVTLLLWMAGAGDLDIGESVPVGIAAILVASATYLLWDRMKNVRRGLPAKDERLIEVSYRAGYYGFIAAIWSAVGGNLAAGILFDVELTGSQNGAVVVLVSGLAFILAYIYLARKGI